MCLTQAELYTNRLGSALAPYLEKWGNQADQIMASLLQEWESGEAELQLRAKEGLRRVIRVLLLDVFYHDPETKQLYFLKEEKQIHMESGKVISRDKDCSVSEKLMAGEVKDREGIPRALWEELGISGSVYYEYVNEFEDVRDSKSYPFLKTLSRNIRYRVLLSPKQYSKEGYEEIRDGVKTYFIWVPYEPSELRFGIRKAIEGTHQQSLFFLSSKTLAFS